MSATKPLSRIEQFLIAYAESRSLAVYNQPFNSLDEERQQRMMAAARKALKNTVLYEPQPGECFSCGKAISRNQAQCWYCHESTHPTPRQLWQSVYADYVHASEV